MSGVVKRLAPDGLAARFALLLVSALLAANVVALLLLSSERARMNRMALADREIERVVALVPALETVGRPQRQTIARDASTRLARIEVGARPLVAATPGDARSQTLAGRLREMLGAREVHAAILDRRYGGEVRDTRRRGDVIAVSIALAGPGPQDWLNIATRGDRRPEAGPARRAFLVVLGLSLAAVLGVGLLFVRHLTWPLTDLAGAAQAAGRGDRSARVPERGAREMREAAAAFNDMQARIARFDAERDRTLAAVGHDLRTPITSLRIRAELLEDPARDDMIRSLDEMAVMAEGLVAFARDRGEAEAWQPVALADLLERLCADRGASLTVERPASVRGRPVALTRAFGNLVDNAIRYGNAARVCLSASDGLARVTIDDDGPGIAPERLATVFEPFVRGEESRNAETGGAGLGLSIARQLLRSHGGEVALANRAGGGLRALVSLPLDGPNGRAESGP